MFLQWFLSHSCKQRSPTTYNHCLYTVQTMLNFAAGSFSYKIILIWLGSSLSTREDVAGPMFTCCCRLGRIVDIQLVRIRGTSITMCLLIIMWWLRCSKNLAKSMRTISITVLTLSMSVYNSCRSCTKDLVSVLTYLGTVGRFRGDDSCV